MKKPEKLRAVLIDRDGVINEEPGPILKPEAFRFVPGSIEAVARINQAGWLCLLVTNQAALARGQMNLGEYAAVTRKMNRELFRSGARMDAMYFCPHHPDWDVWKKRS
ncbi:MAG: D-glycero-beta-D-manno-heptose-1,7-bisphosphate 7-phosphatase, partial [SAR324 cluster bacterium]|nr:D-glycero-beta-D-manno-heptose-1,7-bisphosphate 7-phosphatase [SAR324 cluster bacterium]